MKLDSEKISIELLPHQKEFFDSTAPSTGLICGLGAGKTFVSCAKCIKKLLINGGTILYLVPTIPIARDSIVPKMEELLRLFQVKFNLNKSSNTFETEHGRILLRSMTEPEKIISIDCSYIVCDEMDQIRFDLAKEVQIRAYGRLREPDKECGVNSMDFVTSPNGLQRFSYYYFIKETKPGRVMINASTDDNTFLPHQYFQRMEQEYTLNQMEALRHGRFIPMQAGTVYVSFDRKINRTSREIQATDDTLLIGLDFNYGNCSFVAGIYEDKKLQILDEGTGILNTYQMVEVLKNRYPGKRLIIHPDSSGANNSTSSTWSDIEILTKEFKVAYLRSNPAVMERVNRVNLFFEKLQLVINPNKCKELVNCLENQTFKNGMPDKTVNLDHLPDGLGYMVWQFEIEYHDNPYNSPGSIAIGPNYSSYNPDDDYDGYEDDYDSGWGGTILAHDTKYKTGIAPDGTKYLRDY